MSTPSLSSSVKSPHSTISHSTSHEIGLHSSPKDSHEAHMVLVEDKEGKEVLREAPRLAYSSPLPETAFPTDTYFGAHLFSPAKLEAAVDSKTFAAYTSSLSKNAPLSLEAAEVIAAALLKWAAGMGATHFTHWFQPLTGVPAEKHDTFLDLTRGGSALNRFEGKHLIRGEPDGSSFPSGGLRATHTARGYTAWDVSSHPFVLDHGNGTTLYIPALFYSWKDNQALDDKIPLLRSIEALGRESMAMLGALGETKHTAFKTDSGLEQEFFLIDREYFLRRPDLMVAGRTVLGALPPKGQQLEDHYFGPASDRVLDLIHEFEVVMWRLGVPLQTRHQEVAPGQYEVAPRFAESSLATDRNLLMMNQLRRVARKHGMAALLHEKPFKGVNGSGKHNNWSFGTNVTPSLLDPGDTPERNPRFMLFLAATLKAVDDHNDLMRIAISGAGNDHRLGANEAPPAIVSAYLGDDIEVAVKKFLKGDSSPSTVETKVDLGVHFLPPLTRSSTDRNRTSTFAFTGNKFEFRAVGASHSASRSNTILNTILADALRSMTKEILELKGKGVGIEEAAAKVAKDTLAKHERIIFNGNGYSTEWPEEAKKRGLYNLRTTPEALALYATDKNIKLHESLGVLSRHELAARATVFFEEYVKKVEIEGKVFVNMVMTNVIPVAVDYQLKLKDVIGTSDSKSSSLGRLGSKLSLLTEATLKGVADIEHALHALHSQGNEEKTAKFAEANLLRALHAARVHVDEMETIIPADKWPFPTYHQMLFHQD